LNFIDNFNLTNPRFLENLLKKNPSLTRKEILLCMYIKLNYSNEDISKLMNITRATIDTYRHNLRKKFALTKNHSLVSHLNTLE